MSYKLLCPGRKTSPLRTYMLWRLSWHGCKCSRHITTHIDGQSRRRSRQGPRARRKTDGKAKANVTKRTRNDARRATKKQSLFQRDDAGRAARSNLRRLLRSFASATISITDQSADHRPHPTQHHRRPPPSTPRRKPTLCFCHSRRRRTTRSAAAAVVAVLRQKGLGNQVSASAAVRRAR